MLLNHASFGVPTTRMLAAAEQIRRRIERDAAGLLAGSLMPDIDPSVIRAWQVASAGHGGSVQLAHLDRSIRSPDEVVNEFARQVGGELDVVVASLITSSTP